MNLVETIIASVDNASNGFVMQVYESLATNFAQPFFLMMTLSLIVFGFLLMSGYVQYPVKTLMINIGKYLFATVLLFNWPFFQDTLFNLFTNLPEEIGNIILNTAGGRGFNQVDSFSTGLGVLYDAGLVAAGGAFTSGGWIMKYILGAITFFSVLVLIVSILSLVLLSKVAIAILLGLSPIFIICYVLGITNKIFQAWIQQLINFTLTIILTYAISAFFVSLVIGMINLIINQGKEVDIHHVAPLTVVSLILVLLLKQVPALASALGGGAQVSLLNSVENAGRTFNNLHRGSGVALSQGIGLANQAREKAGRFIKNPNVVKR